LDEGGNGIAYINKAAPVKAINTSDDGMMLPICFLKFIV
jgi:hypothetical protein